MLSEFNFDVLSSILGESTMLDSPRLYINGPKQAAQFIHTYGYDLSKAQDLEKLWRYHRSAIELLENEILEEGESVPSLLRNREELNDITKLLLVASFSESSSEQRESGHSQQHWACAILRVMHVLVHLDNDMFSSFADDIKYQILKPFQDHIYYEDKKTFLGKGEDAIELVSYSEKPFKHTHSAAIKLLTRKNTLAMTLLDRVGLRFVTKDIIDIFKVIQYFIDRHMLSYPHVISSQSKNNICSTSTLKKVLENAQNSEVIAGQGLDNEALDALLREEIANIDLSQSQATNPFSSENFRFLKFINRQFLRINREGGQKPLTFFFPFEIQIADEKTFENNTQGSASHIEYKKRQRAAARQRLFSL